MEPPPLPPEPRSDEDQRPQCWKDVEAETGYSSYRSFLEGLPETGPQFKGLQKILQRRERRGRGFGEVCVLDIQQDGSTSISLMVQSVGGLRDSALHTGLSQYLDISTLKSTQLLHNLRSPPENVPSRIVSWSVRLDYDPDTGIMDALGLGLKIHPHFFETLFSVLGLGNFSFRPIGSDHVKIGDSIAIVARNYRSAEDAPPVLLVASLSDYNVTDDTDDEQDKPYHDMVDEVLKGEIGRSVSFHRSAIDRLSPNVTVSMPSNKYLNILSRLVQPDHDTDAEEYALPWIAMLPLLNLEIVRLCVRCRTVQSALLRVQCMSSISDHFLLNEKNKAHDDLEHQRFWLRRRLEDLEESRNSFVEYLCLHDRAKWLKGKKWLKQNKDLREVIIKARALDAETRDYLQLQIGNLSITESRKSIQLSNQQMDEAKRVKIFTILAFVYVPINLATSIFGMNLQQLNQSGQNLWSFFVTALVSLLVTGSIWFCLEQYNSLMAWKNKFDEELGLMRRPRQSLAVRVAISFERWRFS